LTAAAPGISYPLKLVSRITARPAPSQPAVPSRVLGTPQSSHQLLGLCRLVLVAQCGIELQRLPKQVAPLLAFLLLLDEQFSQRLQRIGDVLRVLEFADDGQVLAMQRLSAVELVLSGGDLG
jgi:hypothetical protein